MKPQNVQRTQDYAQSAAEPESGNQSLRWQGAQKGLRLEHVICQLHISHTFC